MSAILLLIALLAAGYIEASLTCEKQLDVGFLVDGSSTICGDESCPKWDAILQFCKSIVNSLTIGPEQSRVAFLTFSEKVEVKWNLTQYTDKTTLLSAIDNVKYPGGELTEKVSIATIVLDVLNPAKGDRVGVQDIGILISDGAPNNHDEYYAVESAVLQANFVAVFVVCVTPGCTEHCAQGIASPRKKANGTYFLLDDYLKLDQFRDNLVKNFCAWELPQGIADSINT